MGGVVTAGGAGLVGRESELETLLRALEAQALVTITGLPGVGRSALAAAAAAQMAAKGTLVVDVSLATSEGPLAAVDAVMAQLPGPGLSTSLPEAMWEAYGGAPVLLVLEDVDRVQGLGTVVQALVGNYPEALLVCTAARSMGLPGEHVFRLSPLPLPDSAAPADHPCLVLLASLASERGAHIDLADEGQRADAAAVCRLAGGIPGALELAAARLALVPLAVMGRGFGDPDGAVPALQWSFELLSKAAQQALLQLSVFEGPFLLDGVAAIVDFHTPSADSFDVLLELVDTHLLELDPARSGDPHFVVPVFVRDFARSRLSADLMDAEVRDRHARYFSKRGMAGADVVRREWSDIVAALDHEMSNGRLDDALAAAVAIAPEVQEVPGAVASLEQRITELLAQGEHVPARLRARALMWSTHSYPEETAQDMQHLGLWTAQRLAEATLLARESGDGSALLDALERTIRQLRITLDLRTAIAAAHEGLDLARRLGDQQALARFECYGGMAAWSTGDADTAVRLATASIRRGREHGDPFAMTAAAQLLHSLPEELRPALDPPLPSLLELLDQCVQLEQPFTGMTVLSSLAHESLERGEAAAAAGWVWRLLMIAANRQRTEPMATLGAVALLLSVTLASGDRDDATRMREYVRRLELFVPYTLPRAALPRFEEDTALLDTAASGEQQQRFAAEMATMGMDRVNRWAQEVARRLADHRAAALPRRVATHPTADALTPREREVLAALATGGTNREIADLLGLSTKTVMHHSMAVYRKLGVRGRAAATAWAYEHGHAGES